MPVDEAPDICRCRQLWLRCTRAPQQQVLFGEDDASVIGQLDVGFPKCKAFPNLQRLQQRSVDACPSMVAVVWVVGFHVKIEANQALVASGVRESTSVVRFRHKP